MKHAKRKNKEIQLSFKKKKPEAVSITESHGNNKREHTVVWRLTRAGLEKPFA
jgi:hypothetical protein